LGHAHPGNIGAFVHHQEKVLLVRGKEVLLQVRDLVGIGGVGEVQLDEVVPDSGRVVGQGGPGDTPIASARDRSAAITGPLAAFYLAPRPLPPAPAGTVIRSQQLPAGGTLLGGGRAYRVLFHSTSISGADIAESGLVVVPGGSPPPGGFPIVSWAHGTTGVAAGCAPSLEGTSSLPDLRALLRDRVIVAATDYEGLGGPGVHPYLVGLSEAQGVLDAARAARALAGGEAGNTVVAAGYSQGGQAALFTGEVAQSYAPELFLAGVAAIVELDEGPRLMTNVEGVAFDDLRVGMPLVVEYKAISDDVTIPVFRAAS